MQRRRGRDDVRAVWGRDGEENHHPEPLDEAQQEEFERILQAAERELG
jgi:hypothetical protein